MVKEIPMRYLRFLLPVTLILAAPTFAASRGAYSMEVLVDGRPLEEHAARGKHYIEAIEGREYSIRLRNHTGERIAVALAVDGLNTIDAKTTTARAASKWILGPYRTVTLDGWQTGNETARRFFFTTEEKSYGEWLGKTSNLGVITAAVFREKKRPLPQPILKSEAGQHTRRAPSAAADRDDARLEGELSEEMAATGIGRELNHRVRRVDFEAERFPATVIELRYEYHDALVQLGVLPKTFACEGPLDRREQARGFEDTGFAPDPFRAPRP
jgi:hypothetical protein